MGKENEWEEDMKEVWLELIVDEAELWTYGDSLHLSFFLCLFEVNESDTQLISLSSSSFLTLGSMPKAKTFHPDMNFAS